MNARYALIIANSEYTDPGLAQLTAPGNDAEDFSHVLQDKDLCDFDEVNLLLNQPEHIVRGAIDEFYDQKKPDDLLVLYFSGHGVRDELGSLYLAVKNTIRTRLRSTAIKSDYIREAMENSRSRRQVLILDCCNSGAFAQGTKAATGVSIGTATAFDAGYGRVILTASDSTQFAWEGDKVIGETDKSLFTHYLVEGLNGEADLNGDGRITVDELYDYAYEKVKLATPKQSPSKFSSKQQGEIVLREKIKLEDIKSVPLPDPLLDSIENPFADVRLGAVQQLAKLLNGKNLGLARSAREALEDIAQKDDSRQVSRAAKDALGLFDQVEQPASQEQAAGMVPQTAQSEVSARIESSVETDLPKGLAFVTLGWAVAGLIGGFIYNELGTVLAGAIAGAIGGLITAIALREGSRSNQQSMIWMTIAWAVGGAAGWTIGEAFTEAVGMAIGFTSGAAISLAILIGTGQAVFHWKPMMWIVLAWAIGAAIGWSLARGLINNAGWDYSPGWTTGMALGWAIGGFVTGWQLGEIRKKQTGNSTGTLP
jgi:hypothetical protein